MAKNLIEHALKTIRRYDMVRPGDGVLIAISGGPDSVFLLHALLSLKNKLKLDKICACHLDHGLRGAASKRDSAFVKKICLRYGVDLFRKTINLRKMKSKELSTEELGRRERYAFFKDAATKAGVSVIATGHTLDDQAETVLMRFIRGSSLKGLAGIPPVREDGNLRIIRPLLELGKEEVRALLDQKGIKYRIDCTNLKSIYFRNAVRAEIIPFLERYNPRLKKVLFSLAGHLREDFEFIKDEKSRQNKRIFRPGKGLPIEISLAAIVVQPRALQKEILRDALENSGGEVKRLSFGHWKELEDLILRKRKNSSVDVPGSIRVTRTENTLTFRKR